MASPLQTAIAARGLDTMSDPNDVLNLQYKKYKNSLYSQSLSKPSEYFQLRGTMSDTLKEAIVSDLYLTIYNLLRKGFIMKGTTKVKVCGLNADLTDREPGYPSAEVNKLSLQITATLDDFMEEVINILMPPSFLALADNKLQIKSENVL